MQSKDEVMMERALKLSLKARLISPPNPWVGCVIVKDGHIIGEGHTQPPGQAHAEVMALRQAKDNAAGATVYATLEPCSHFGKTPPCTKALIEAKVARVVIGLVDPDDNVSGKGIHQLKAAGIEVVTGVCADAITRALEPYLYHRKTGRPFCVGKTAVSIDGRIAAQDKTSQWISSPEARQEAQRYRAESQAILVGAGTACADKPRLTVRDQQQMPMKPPLRVVLDSKGRVPAEGPLFDTKETPTLIVTTEECPKDVRKRWLEHNVEVAIVSKGANGTGVNLEETLDLLGKRGVLQILIEGGGIVLGSFFEMGLIQRFHLFVGPVVLGNHGLPAVSTDAITTLSEGFKLRLLGVEVFGDTVCINYTNGR